MKHVLLGLLLLLVPFAVLADGPETGVVSGKVSDTQGQALPGVTVTLTGERGQQSSITDASGGYRFALLPPGSYAVKAELQGFDPVESAANVRAGGKSDVNLTLRLGTSEEITVTSEVPLVDKFNVTAGASLSAEVGEQSAGENRTYYGVINMLPGVASDSENGDIQGTRPNVNGAHFADSGVFIDGVDTTFARFGGSRVILPTTSTAEITLEAGGSSAEYGRFVGSATNVIVKSGTNSFHGAVGGTYEDTGWSADYKSHPELFSSREFSPYPADFLKRSPAEEDTDATSYELTFGGPLKRDKAWFFLGLSKIDTNDLDKTLNRDPVDTSWESESRIAKLNFQPSAKHQLALTYIDAPQFRVYFHSPSGDQYTPTPHDLPGHMGTFNWNFSASSKFFLETKLATQSSDENKFLAVAKGDICSSCPLEEVVAEALAIKQRDPRFPPNPALGRHYPGNNYNVYVDSEDDDSWHNGWLLDNGFGTNEYPREQLNASGTWFATQNHELRFGLDYQNVKWESNVRKTNVYSGPRFNALSPSGYLYNPNRPAANFTDCSVALGRICFFADYNLPDLLAQGNAFESDNTNTALFVRDRFTVGDHWTFNIGLRGEQMTNKNTTRDVVDQFVLGPRFTTTYDVKGDGKMLVTFAAGRHQAQLNQQLTNQWLADKWPGYYGQDNFLWCSPEDVFLGSFVPVLRSCNQRGVGYNFQIARRRPGQMFDMIDRGVFDWELEPYWKDEAILGFEWQFSKNWALDSKAIYWELGNMIGNTIQRADNGQLFELTANYKDYVRILDAIGRVPDANLAQFREGWKEYAALQLQLNRRYANGWALYNNLTLSDTETSGSGAWWNNWNSSYGYFMEIALNQNHIEICKNSQLGFASAFNASGQIVRGARVSNGRTVPVDCQGALQPFLGVPVSLINREGKDGVASERYDEGGNGADKPVIWKTFGFKQWDVGSHTFTAGGLFIYQSGMAWRRVEEIDNTLLGFSDPTDPFNLTGGTNGVDIAIEPNGERRIGGNYTLNLSGAWGFPLAGKKLNGEVRIEATNVTNQQRQLGILDKGETRAVRRDYQRPREFRTLFTLRF